MDIRVRAIATVHNARGAAVDDDWGEVESRIELAPELPAESLVGLEAFSHVEVLFFFDRVAADEIEHAARHPRGNTAWPRVGIFAQRGKNRPNRLGSTIARVLRREERTLHVVGLDAVDGTPVLDLKPVMREFLPRETVVQPEWVSELMADYWRARSRA